MKKLVSLLVVGVLALSCLTGCGATNVNAQEPANATVETKVSLGEDKGTVDVCITNNAFDVIATNTNGFDILKDGEIIGSGVVTSFDEVIDFNEANANSIVSSAVDCDLFNINDEDGALAITCTITDATNMYGVILETNLDLRVMSELLSVLDFRYVA